MEDFKQNLTELQREVKCSIRLRYFNTVTQTKTYEQGYW